MSTRRLLVVPTGRGVGLTSVCLGLVRALDRLGVSYAFCRPISVADGPDHSSLLMQSVARLDPPAPITRDEADELLGSGQEDVLLEQVVERVERAGRDAAVVVVEGLVPLPDAPFAARMNVEMAKALDAEVVLVAVPADDDPARVANQLDIIARDYGELAGQRCCILNRIPVTTKPVNEGALAGNLGDAILATPADLRVWADALEAEDQGHHQAPQDDQGA